MSATEGMKFIGKRRAAAERMRKRANIGRPFRSGTRPRAKTVRRIAKQVRMGLSGQHKEVPISVEMADGWSLLRHPTKSIVYGIALRMEHPDPEAAKVNAPYYAAVQRQLPRAERHSKDQRRQSRVG